MSSRSKFGVCLMMGVLFLSGCQSQNTAYESAVAAGVTAIAKGNYRKAAASFDLALQAEPRDQAAIDYQQQTALLEKSERQLQAGKIGESKQTVAELLARSDLSRSVKQQGDAQASAVKAAQKVVDDFDNRLKTIRQSLAEDDYDEALNQLIDARNVVDGNPALAEERGELDKLLVRLVKQKAAYDVAEKVKELTPDTTEETPSAPLVPEVLQGHWYGTPPDEKGSFATQTPVLTLTKDTLMFAVDQRVYQITANKQWQNQYTLSWDLNAFSRRYGNGSLGENPVPFQFYLVPATEETPYTTLTLGEQTFYRE